MKKCSECGIRLVAKDKRKCEICKRLSQIRQERRTSQVRVSSNTSQARPKRKTRPRRARGLTRQ